MWRNNALDMINSFYGEEKNLVEKKAEYFDQIAQLFYKGNFGAATKSEIELLMFSILMDEMIDHNQDSSGVLDYKACSDYKMAEMLGIPESRIKTLKIRKQARYPKEFDWKKSFESLKDLIVYDIDKKRIIIPVSDPNLYLAIKNVIEENDGYIEIQRGSNILQMRPEHFFILLYWGLENEDEKESIKKNFTRYLKEKNEKNDIDDIRTDKELADAVISTGGDILDLCEVVLENITNPGMLILKSIRVIGKAVKKVIK